MNCSSRILCFARSATRRVVSTTSETTSSGNLSGLFSDINQKTTKMSYGFKSHHFCIHASEQRFAPFCMRFSAVASGIVELIRRDGHRFLSSFPFTKLQPQQVVLQISDINSASVSSFHKSKANVEGPFAARLKSRGVVSLDGPDTVHFLQGLVTNDVSMYSSFPAPLLQPFPTPNQPAAIHPPLYCALLSPQGRVLFDLFFFKPPLLQPTEMLDPEGRGPNFSSSNSLPFLFADVDSKNLDEFLSILKRHKLRAKVSFEDASRDYSVWARFAGPVTQASASGSMEEEAGGVGWGGAVDILGQMASEASRDGWSWHYDPRLRSLGLRGIFPAAEIPPLVEADETVEEDEFWQWRYGLGVAEGCREISKGEALPLEYNLAGLNGVSFEKGCYVGQELTARTHHRGIVRKRVMPICFVDQNGAEIEGGRFASSRAVVVEERGGKKVGKVIAALESRGLALVRLESALNPTSKLRIASAEDEESVYVRPQQPNWWAEEWGKEEGAEESSA